MKKLFWTIGILTMLIGCLFIPVNPSTEKYGYFYGECITGDCEVNLTVLGDSLILDKVRRHDTAIYDSARFGKRLPSQQFRLKPKNVNDFKIALPLYMLFKGRTIGCPDCTDGGGVILEYSMFGIEKKFTIDRIGLPFYIKNLGRQVDEKIAEAEKISD
jgi:hypothetical protein